MAPDLDLLAALDAQEHVVAAPAGNTRFKRVRKNPVLHVASWFEALNPHESWFEALNPHDDADDLTRTPDGNTIMYLIADATRQRGINANRLSEIAAGDHAIARLGLLQFIEDTRLGTPRQATAPLDAALAHLGAAIKDANARAIKLRLPAGKTATDADHDPEHPVYLARYETPNGRFLPFSPLPLLAAERTIAAIGDLAHHVYRAHGPGDLAFLAAIHETIKDLAPERRAAFERYVRNPSLTPTDLLGVALLLRDPAVPNTRHITGKETRRLITLRQQREALSNRLLQMYQDIGAPRIDLSPFFESIRDTLFAKHQLHIGEATVRNAREYEAFKDRLPALIDAAWWCLPSKVTPASGDMVMVSRKTRKPTATADDNAWDDDEYDDCPAGTLGLLYDDQLTTFPDGYTYPVSKDRLRVARRSPPADGVPRPGDAVEVIGGTYTITAPGSRGILRDRPQNASTCCVWFYHLPKQPHDQRRDYDDIRTANLRLLTPDETLPERPRAPDRQWRVGDRVLYAPAGAQAPTLPAGRIFDKSPLPDIPLPYYLMLEDGKTLWCAATDLAPVQQPIKPKRAKPQAQWDEQMAQAKADAIGSLPAIIERVEREYRAQRATRTKRIQTICDTATRLGIAPETVTSFFTMHDVDELQELPPSALTLVDALGEARYWRERQYAVINGIFERFGVSVDAETAYTRAAYEQFKRNILAGHEKIIAPLEGQPMRLRDVVLLTRPSPAALHERNLQPPIPAGLVCHYWDRADDAVILRLDEKNIWVPKDSVVGTRNLDTIAPRQDVEIAASTPGSWSERYYQERQRVLPLGTKVRVLEFNKHNGQYLVKYDPTLGAGIWSQGWLSGHDVRDGYAVFYAKELRALPLPETQQVRTEIAQHAPAIFEQADAVPPPAPDAQQQLAIRTIEELRAIGVSEYNIKRAFERQVFFTDGEDLFRRCADAQ